MKKEFPFSFRLDEKTFDRIQEVKKEYEWNNDSEAGRNILEVGLEYLIMAKEFQKNPELEVEINEKMLKLLQSLAVENKIESILKNFDQDIIQIIFRLSYLENKERENENKIKAQQLEEAENEARKRQKEAEEQAEELKKWHEVWRVLPSSGKGIIIKCRMNQEHKTVDIDDNVVDWSQINDHNDLPKGIEFIRYLEQSEVDFISGN